MLRNDHKRRASGRSHVHKGGRLGSEYRVRLDVEDRQQLALELAALLKDTVRHRTFWELAEGWLKRLVRVRPENERVHLRHLGELHGLREGEITKATVESALAKLDKVNGGTLGPATLNKLRSTGKLVVDDARAIGEWTGPNPFQLVKCRRIPRKPWPRISPEEFIRVLAHLREDRRRLALVAICTGMRPGELKALQKQDVDLERGFISVQRSLGRDETKTGMSRTVPIPDACAAALQDAITASSSRLVFPRPDGSRERDDVKLSRILRTAFKAAGVVTHFHLTCRRKNCLHAEDRPGLTVNVDCPKCGMRLWCSPIAKPFTFYGLRHAAATMHREAGADALAVKLALGHVLRSVTDDVYTHLSDEKFKAELNRLVLPNGTVALQRGVDTRLPAPNERRKGFEPSTPSLGSCGPAGVEAGGQGLLLTVPQVAAVFQVSNITVYRLVRSGRLLAVRICSCLRFTRETIEDFVFSREAIDDTESGTGSAGAGGAGERRVGAAEPRRRPKLHRRPQ